MNCVFAQVRDSGLQAVRPTGCERNAEKPGETTAGGQALWGQEWTRFLGPNVISISNLDFIWCDLNLTTFWEVNSFKHISIDGLSVA